jgi:hypothetical protein
MGLFSNIHVQNLRQSGGGSTDAAGALSGLLPTCRQFAGSSRGTAASVPVAAAAPAAAPPSAVDVASVLDGLAKQNPEKLDWRRSIVDLMKLVGIDSSLSARKELARELNYQGDTSDSAKMNIWLHKEVIKKLAANGGKVPAALLD